MPSASVVSRSSVRLPSTDRCVENANRWISGSRTTIQKLAEITPILAAVTGVVLCTHLFVTWKTWHNKYVHIALLSSSYAMSFPSPGKEATYRYSYTAQKP